MNERNQLSSNLGLDLVRATEAAALSAGRGAGLGQLDEAERAAATAMSRVPQNVEIDGRLCLGEEARLSEHAAFVTGQRLGTGRGPAVDVLADAIDGRRLLAGGYPGALAAIAVAPQGAIWFPTATRYMEKIMAAADVGPALVPECLDAPAAWTLALVARAKGKQVRDLVVFVLDRPRHADLVAEIRAAGAHVLLRTSGDIGGVLLAGLHDGQVDLLMGTGGVPHGLLVACEIKATRGAMLGRLIALTQEEEAALRAAPAEDRRIHTVDELVAGSQVFFAATGITDNPLLNGVRYHGSRAQTSSILLRGETGIRRIILTEHLLAETERPPSSAW
ncbi:MAG: fructose-bisphosphatase class II family protein [Anaerolineae bacterium]